MNRYRSYLLAGGSLILCIAALAGAAACSGSASPPEPPPIPEVSAVVITRDLGLGENRIAFGLVDLNGMPVRREQVQVRALLLPPTGGPGEERGSAVATFNKWPMGEQGVFTTKLSFDEAGFWEIEATITGDDGQPDTAKGAVEVREKAESPAIGEPAPRSVTATVADTDDIATITSAFTPDPDLYQVSLHDALEQAQPVVVAFSTPRFCVSATCGPQLEVVSRMKERYSGRANFIHVEVFKDPHLIRGGRPPTEGPDGGGGSPYVPAVEEWNLPSEPWTFVIDRTGRVHAKFEQFTTEEELEAALVEVLGS